MSETQRRFGRFAVQLPSTFSVEGQTHQLTISNISVGGFFAQCEEAELMKNLTVESVVHVSIPLSDKDTIASQARVTWRNQEGVGFAFERLKPLDVWLIIQLNRTPQKAFYLSTAEATEAKQQGTTTHNSMPDVDQELG